MEPETQNGQLLTLENIFEALDEIEDRGEIDSARMYDSANPYIVVRRGSSNVIVRYLNEPGEEHEVDQIIFDGSLIELWSMVVTGLKNLTQENKIEIYEFIGSRVFRVGPAKIDSEGTLFLESTLPAEDLSPMYCARYIAEFVDFVDGIDSDIAKRWDGLTAIDEGPDRDQGSANHAEY
jgi:hypothetical protein